MRPVRSVYLIRFMLVVGMLASIAHRAEASLLLEKSFVGPIILCEDDDIVITIRVTAIGVDEIFDLVDVIEADWYSFWITEASSGTPCSVNEGFLVAGGSDGTFCTTGVSLSAGTSIDFVYRARVRWNCLSPTICQTATAIISTVMSEASLTSIAMVSLTPGSPPSCSLMMAV